MDRPSEDVLSRMPLAESVMLLWKWVTAPERMQAIWDKNRGKCYEKTYLFRCYGQLNRGCLD
jgi:hypothetical protein